MADDPEQRVRLVTDLVTGQLQPRILPRRTTKLLEDGTREEGMVIDASTSAEEIKSIILRAHKRERLEPPSHQELDKKIIEIRSSAISVERPEIKTSVKVDIAAYKRGLLKIAYELACIWLGDRYLGDPLAAVIRDVILGRVKFEDAKVRGTADLVRPEALSLWPADDGTHLAYAMVAGGSICISLKIFETLFMVVQITDQPALYSIKNPDANALRFIEINVRDKTRRETLFSEEIIRISHAVPIGVAEAPLGRHSRSE